VRSRQRPRAVRVSRCRLVRQRLLQRFLERSGRRCAATECARATSGTSVTSVSSGTKRAGATSGAACLQQQLVSLHGGQSYECLRYMTQGPAGHHRGAARRDSSFCAACTATASAPRDASELAGCVGLGVITEFSYAQLASQRMLVHSVCRQRALRAGLQVVACLHRACAALRCGPHARGARCEPARGAPVRASLACHAIWLCCAYRRMHAARAWGACLITLTASEFVSMM
jgi:hypothetical protein